MSFISSISPEDLQKLDCISFPGEIHVIDSLGPEFNKAVSYLRSQDVIGFDTETRPSFSASQPRYGVALLQLSGPSKAFLFRIKKTGMHRRLCSLLSDKRIIKVGAAVYDDICGLQKYSMFTPNSFVDLQKEEKSYINMRDFRMRGGGTVIGLKGNVEDLLTDPVVKAKLDAEINFEDFTRIFPLAEGITCKGDLKAALLGNVLVRDVMEGNYGKIRVGGGLQAKNVHVFIPQDSIVARIRSAGLAFASNRENKHTLQGKDLLNGFVGYSGLNIHVKNRLRLLMDTTYLTLKTSPLRDTTAVASVSSRLKLGRTLFIVRDTLLLGLKQATANASLRPRAKNPKAPRIHARVQIDSLRSRVMANRLNIAHADVTLNAVQNARNKKRWVPSGDIEFSGLRAFTPFFPVRISMPGTHLRFNRNEVSLDSALIRLGRSDLYLTGNITNLARSFFRHDTLRGELRRRYGCRKPLTASCCVPSSISVSPTRWI